MKDTELRIGNLVNFNVDRSYYLGIIRSLARKATLSVEDNTLPLHKFFDGIKYVNIEPIPLTEEWLVKFGFEKDETKHIYRIQLDEYVLEVSMNAFSGTLEKDTSWFISIITGFGSQPVTVTKSYVHQLQNLYVALTGEELEINNQ